MSAKVSIVVPVKNEQENVAPLLDEVETVLGRDPAALEVIMVDDGSTDETLAVIRREAGARPYLRWLQFDRNHGQTAAFDAGLRAATGAFLVTMDGDLQNDPADIPRLLRAAEPVDMVCGYRRTRRDSWVRRLSSRLANRVRNAATGDDIIDTGCSLKVMRRACLDRLKLYEGMHRFLPTLVRMEGFRVAQLDVNHRPRTRGRAKYGIGNRAFRATADLLAVCWMQRRLLAYKVVEAGGGGQGEPTAG